MARYKPIGVSPRFLAVDLKRQLLPGTPTSLRCVGTAPNAEQVRRGIS